MVSIPFRKAHILALTANNFTILCQETYLYKNENVYNVKKGEF